MSRHIHLDAVGGVAGDMFAAAMLELFPEARENLARDLGAAGIASHARLVETRGHSNNLACRRVRFEVANDAPSSGQWRDIRQRFETSELAPPVRDLALSIFGRLAAAEARCHGIGEDDVHFHEIADWDSQADIVAAASLIAYAGAASWSVSDLPRGTGRVQTQHGVLPVPAPATLDLLHGFTLIDDGEAGERVTPTGAAILAELVTAPDRPPPRGRVVAVGIGAGQRALAGRPNILRATLLEVDDAGIGRERVGQLQFDIDDMTPEEIAVALDHIRAATGVLDAGYVLGVGKKGRTRFAITVLTDAEAVDAAAETCFGETSTLGIKIAVIDRLVLAREAGGLTGVPVKIAARPGGATIKAESDALARHAGLKRRRALARRAESDSDA